MELGSNRSDSSDVVPAPQAEDTLETKEPVQSVAREQMEGVHQYATALMNEVEKLPGGDLINEMIATALKLLRDENNRADLKLINTSLKELRYAMKVPAKVLRAILLVCVIATTIAAAYRIISER